MISDLTPPLRPRKGAVLRVLSVERISTVQQDVKALDDQLNKTKEFLSRRYDGEVDWKSISSQGSGERLDRRELLEVEEAIDSGSYDLVLVEDLGRICRRIDAFKLCELAEDSETRVIAINDNVDTFQDNWRLNAFFAAMRHEMYNRDTAARIRRTLRSRFSLGGALGTLPFGYIRPPEVELDNDVHKDPAIEPLFDRWFEMLEDGASFSEVSDWLTGDGVPVGRYCRSGRWSPQMVARITYNPILKGLRVHSRRTTKRVNKTGVRKSVKAPLEERLERMCPHLAFIEPERYDRVIRMLRNRNEKFRRGKALAQDQRNGVPRKRTVWPGQSITCGVCGRILYYGAHGRPDRLICSGANQYQCWNSIGVSGTKTAERICKAVWAEIEALPDFEAALVESIQHELRERQAGGRQRLDGLKREVDRVGRQKEALLVALKDGRAADLVLSELERVRDEEALRREELTRLEQSLGESVAIPTIEELRREAAAVFLEMPRDTPEFARQMNRILRDLRVIPVRSLDGGQPVLRAHMTLDLTTFAPANVALLGCSLLERTLEVDLFDPPQRIQFFEEIIRLSKLEGDEYLTERQIASQLGITQPIVQQAKRLARNLEAAATTDPYVEIADATGIGTKHRRQRHPRFRFEPKNRGDK